MPRIHRFSTLVLVLFVAIQPLGFAASGSPQSEPATLAPSGGAPANSQGSGPSIELVKTVGPDANPCASEDNVRLPLEGGTVTYCYRINNTGSITLTQHNLNDSQLGSVLTDFPYDLAPGTSAYLTQSVVITASIINTATWVANNPGPTDVVTATDTARVEVGAWLYLPLITRVGDATVLGGRGEP